MRILNENNDIAKEIVLIIGVEIQATQCFKVIES